MIILRNVLIALLLLGVGAATGRWLAPSKVVEKIVYQEKIVEKKVFVQDKQQKNNKVTIKLVTIKPDGTKTIETKVVDKTEIEIVQNSSSSSDHTTTKTEEKTTEYTKSNWLVNVGVKTTFGVYQPDFGIQVNRRIFGPIFLEAFGFTDKSIGVGVGLEL